MYLISVYFDDKSNKIISNYINKIAQERQEIRFDR